MSQPISLTVFVKAGDQWSFLKSYRGCFDIGQTYNSEFYAYDHEPYNMNVHEGFCRYIYHLEVEATSDDSDTRLEDLRAYVDYMGDDHNYCNEPFVVYYYSECVLGSRFKWRDIVSHWKHQVPHVYDVFSDLNDMGFGDNALEDDMLLVCTRE